MRWLSILSIALLTCACHGSAPGADAGADTPGRSFDQPIGAACDPQESLWCAHGVGICYEGSCCQFCSAVQLPRCPTGTVEVHALVGGRQICLCGPG